MKDLQQYLTPDVFNLFTPRDDVLCAYYDHVAEHFRTINFGPRDIHAGRTGVALAWSWMGLALPRPDWQAFYPAFCDALSVSDTSQVDDKLCHEASKFVGGSFIGASKFLHFKFPEVYPIWDGNIAHVTHGLKGVRVRTAHQEYREYSTNLASMQIPANLSEEFERRELAHWTKVRKLEFVLYLAGRGARREVRRAERARRRAE